MTSSILCSLQLCGLGALCGNQTKIIFITESAEKKEKHKMMKVDESFLCAPSGLGGKKIRSLAIT
jgi:hypothetical protein